MASTSVVSTKTADGMERIAYFLRNEGAHTKRQISFEIGLPLEEVEALLRNMELHKGVISDSNDPERAKWALREN